MLFFWRHNKMKRFVLSTPPNPDGMIHLYEKDYHYLVRVRRLKNGMCFDAILPGGTETQVRVLSTVDNILIGECLGSWKEAGGPSTTLSPPATLALFQGLPRGAKMDLIVRQAAEMGVSFVVPFQSEYSTAKQGVNPAGKINRWERIVKEARQQSGSSGETKVFPPCGFDAIFGHWESLKKGCRRPQGILLHQEPLEKGSFHGYLGSSPDFVAIAVGPEGGFSPREVPLFLAAGFKPVVIGNNILRTETAAISGIAAIRIIILENKNWSPGPTE